jgi:dihydroorotate dehydrogenase electron transfer subunit
MDHKIHADVKTGQVIENLEIVKSYFVLSILLRSSQFDAMPGQFVMIRKQNVNDPLLSRPLGIYGVHQTEAGPVVEFLYRIVGRGTSALSHLVVGDHVDILAPLGNPFDLNFETRSHIVLIAGGVGLAPLTYLAYYLSDTMAEKKLTLYIGVSAAPFLVGLNRIKHSCPNIEIKVATNDGSMGFKGTITDLFQNDIPSMDHGNIVIFACGPRGMDRHLARIIAAYDIPCHISMEERMACGIGTCLGCAIKIRTSDNSWVYRRVCKDGPIFNIRDIIWD